MERRLAAVLVSDVVGYTKLMEEDTEGTVTAWSEARDDIIEPSVQSHKGRIVKFTGDGFLTEFKTVQDALNCAIHLQNSLFESPLKFRMAVNLGDIIDDGRDIHGEGINIAARLEALAEPGGICISGAVYDQVRNRINAKYEELGFQDVKNVSEPVMAYNVSAKINLGEETKPENLAGDLSIAVLPFDNMSNDPEQEFFTDGIVEDIITELSFLKNIRVIARNSSFAYKGQSIDIRKVGQELDVNHVLEGSVRKSGDSVRITAQLIVTKDNSHRWAKRYDGTLENIFELQSEIAENIASELDLEFASKTDVSKGQDAVKKKEAHDIARRGRQVALPPNLRNIEASKKFYRHAITIYEKCALAYAGLGHADIINAWHYEFNKNNRDALIKSGTKQLNYARELDPTLALSYVSLSVSFLIRERHDDAWEIARDVVKKCPNDPVAYFCFGLVSTAIEKYDEALSAIDKAIDLDPLHLTNYLVLTHCRFAMGDYQDAINSFENEFGEAPIEEFAPYDWSLIIASYLKLNNKSRASKLWKSVKKVYPEYNSEILKNNGTLLPKEVTEDLVKTLRDFIEGE